MNDQSPQPAVAPFPRHARGGWIDPVTVHLRWVRTIVPSLTGLALLATWSVRPIDGLLAAALIVLCSGVVVGPLLYAASRRLGERATLRASLWIDLAIVAIAVAQVDHLAPFTLGYVWPVVLAGMLAAPRDTALVAIATAAVATASPLLRDVQSPAVVAVDAIVLLAIAAMIAALRTNEHRATVDRRSLGRQLETAQRLARIGSYEYELATGRGRWSDELYRMFGLTKEATAVDRESFLSMVVDDDRDRVAALTETPSALDYACRVRRPDGRVIHVRVLGEQVEDERGRLLIGTVQDVTELRRLDAMRDEFVAAASHELRTPTSVVLGFATTLARRWDELSEADRRRFVEQIDGSARRLALLIEDVLQATQVESGQVRCQRRPFDLAAELMDLVETWPGSARIMLELDSAGRAVGDAVRTRQVVGNLLANAERYSPAGAEVRLRVSAEEDALRVDVTDHGPGIPEEAQERIFERFVRLSSDAQGTGLGLYISRQLAEAQGGTLDVASEPGRGSTFTYRLPADPGRVEA